MEKILSALLILMTSSYYEAKIDRQVTREMHGQIDTNICETLTCEQACTVWGIQLTKKAPDNCVGVYDCTACLENAKRPKHNHPLGPAIIIRSKY